MGVKKYAKAYLEKFTSEREFIKEQPLGKKNKNKNRTQQQKTSNLSSLLCLKQQ